MAPGVPGAKLMAQVGLPTPESLHPLRGYCTTTAAAAVVCEEAVLTSRAVLSLMWDGLITIQLSLDKLFPLIRVSFLTHSPDIPHRF